MAENNGGAISFTAEDGYTVNILSSTFNSNSANYASSIYLSEECNGNIKNNVFINNKANEEILTSLGSVSAKSVFQGNILKSANMGTENLKLEFLNVQSYYGDVCQVKFTKDGKSLANKKIMAIALSNDGYSLTKFEFSTDSKGIGKFAFASQKDYIDVGMWDIDFIADSGSNKLVESINKLNIKKSTVNANLNSVSTNYASGKTVSVKVTNKNTNGAVGNVGLYATIYKNGYYLKEYNLVTNLNGIVNVKIISDLSVGNYKLEITSRETSSQMALDKKSVDVKISKAPTKISAPKVTNTYKKSKYFKVTVKNGASKKVVKNVKVKIKVYTGKKYKTFTVKTNSKGVAQINTKTLKRGTHKVVITSGNSNYQISKTSSIKIK